MLLALAASWGDVADAGADTCKRTPAAPVDGSSMLQRRSKSLLAEKLPDKMRLGPDGIQHDLRKADEALQAKELASKAYPGPQEAAEGQAAADEEIGEAADLAGVAPAAAHGLLPWLGPSGFRDDRRRADEGLRANETHSATWAPRSGPPVAAEGWTVADEEAGDSMGLGAESGSPNS